MSKMSDEIRQQPAAIERTLKAEWKHAQKLRRHFEQKPIRMILLAARGTSDNAAQFGRYLLEISTGIPVSLAAPSVTTLYHSKLKLQDTAVVAISQSGESTDTNLVLELAKESGAFTVGITNEADSSLAKMADETLLVRAEKETSVAATKTYTGQLTCFYLLAYALGAPIEEHDLHKIPDWSAAALKLEDEIRDRAQRYCFMHHALCVGRGLNYSNSFEFALKLMETCYVVAERFSSADLLHGPIAMIGEHFPAFVFCPSGPTWKSSSELLEKLDAIKAESTLITDESNLAAAALKKSPRNRLTIPADISFKGPLPEEVYTPIPYIIPAQLFAANLAEVKGLDPDRPRTLSKVTLTI
jgi:glucosamine--fructose-6-phosphate aminotransferase (isomerizing)